MQRWDGPERVPRDIGRPVVTIGVFDGVHHGHRQVLAEAVRLGAERGAPAVAVTFDPHPREVLTGVPVPRLTGIARRAELMERCGIDAVLVLHFSPELAALPAERFVREILVDRLRALHVHVGSGFRFGHRGAGSAATLASLGLGVSEHPVVQRDAAGPRFSSTLARALVAEGRMSEAAAVLGRPHRVEGTLGGRDRLFSDRTDATVRITPGAALPQAGTHLARMWSAGTGPVPVRVRVPGGGLLVEPLDRIPAGLRHGSAVAVDFSDPPVAPARDRLREVAG